MLEQTKETLLAYGMDLQGTLARFVGNEALMLSFLDELSEDENIAAMKAARERGDADAFSAAVHALKGLSGNLGLTPLYEKCTELMAALRAGDTASADRLYPLVCGELDRAVRVISGLPKE